MRRPSRRGQGFERAGNVPAGELGLPRERSRELLLARAWERVAGEAIARRAPALRIQRGVLEIEVPNERWSETLTPLLPRLAARLAAFHPDLKIRKFRLRPAGESAAGPPQPLSTDALNADVPPSPEPPVPPTDMPRNEDGASARIGSGEQRLRLVAQRYLDRVVGPR